MGLRTVRLLASCALISIFGIASLPAGASAAATTTTLTVTAGGQAATSIATGSTVTLTAAVAAGSTKVTTGLVNFCDAAVNYCTDIHLLGSAQLTSAGTATLSVEPAIGSHRYKAVFVGTKTNAGSASASSGAVTVSGLQPTATAIVTSYDGELLGPQTVTVGSAGTAAPSGQVSFLDVSEDKAVLGTATLGAGTAGLALLNPGNYNSGGASVQLNLAALGDFNGDGFLDIAGSNLIQVGQDGISNQATVILGDGKGNFTAAAGPTVSLGDSNSNMPVSVGDFNGDGKLDMVVAAEYGTPNLFVVLGNGDGTFTAGPTYTAASQLGPITVADFNGDGIPDLAVADTIGNLIFFYTGNGDGSFTPSTAAPSNILGPSAMVAGDFNGDGIADLAVLGDAANVTLLLANGDGSFTKTVGPLLGVFPAAIASGDFNGDGKLDLAVGNEGDGSVSVLLGNGDGSFSSAAGSPITVEPSGSDSPNIILTGDFNGDGKLDIAFAPGNGLLLGNGDGTFSEVKAGYAGQDGTGSLGPAADFNADGLTDFAGRDTPMLTVTEIASGSATIAVEPGKGSQLVAASYPANSTFAGSESGSLLYLANSAASTTTLKASPNPAVQGATVTLTATVTSSGIAPTGTVTFYYGSAELGTAALNAAGVASYSTSKLTVGAVNTSAGYNGDTNNIGSDSGVLVLTVTAPPVSVAVPTPPAVTAGADATATVTFTAGSTYAGTLNLACSLTTSPAGAQSVPACSLSPTTLALKASGTGTSALTVTTTASSTTASLAPESRKSLWGLGTGTTVLAMMWMCGIPARRRRWLSMLALCIFAVAGAIGCGGGGGGTKGTMIPATTSGNYTFTVTGTDSANATITSSATVVVTVQ